MKDIEAQVRVAEARAMNLVADLVAVATTGAEAMKERDAARAQVASLREDLRSRRTGYAFEEWMDEHSSCRTRGSEYFRGEEEMELMKKLRTWWSESDGEHRTIYWIWREPVTLDEGLRILELWGFNPHEQGCHCAGDCCGHWFSDGARDDSPLVWSKGYARNV